MSSGDLFSNHLVKIEPRDCTLLSLLKLLEISPARQYSWGLIEKSQVDRGIYSQLCGYNRLQL